MTNAEKIFAIRKSLGMSRKDFGYKLGVSESVINNIETKGVELNPLMSDLICRVYNVNPIYMKTGEGEMFINVDKVLLNKLKEAYNLNNNDLTIIKNYIQLNTNKRKIVIDVIKSLVKDLVKDIDT